MKSDELQGLRGVAVIAVVLFHLKVDYVGRGFLGVDVRLLPSFALLLFFITLSAPFVFIMDEVDTAVNEISLSMPFMINLKFAAETQNYWTKDKDFSSIVMHVWSLALEMQFYLLVPLIYWAVNRLEKHEHRLAAHSSILIASLLLHYLERSESRQFYLLHNRLWQFVAGFVVLELQEKIKDKRKLAPVSIAASIVLFWLLSGTSKPDTRSGHLLFRLATILCTSVIVLLAGIGGNRMLSMRWLVYAGDVSYILYLVHWPVIVLVHVWMMTMNSCAILLCLLISVPLSVLVHHCFEKPLLKRNFSDCFTISMSLYMVTLFAIATRAPQELSEMIIEYRQNGNSTLHALMQWNYREATTCCNSIPKVDCLHDDEAERWTDGHTNPKGTCIAQGNGTLSVLVLGNSVSISSFETVHRVLDGRYRTLRLFAREGCWMLFGTCPSFWDKVTVVVERMKPDVILITESQRLMNDRPGDASVLVQAQERIDYLSSHAKAVMVDAQYLIPDFAHSSAMAHYLARGWTNTSTMPGLSMSLEQQFALKRTAYDRITSLRGDNLVVNNITFAFCERIRGMCEGFNPSTLKAYTQTGVHVNSYGYELLEPIYRRSIEKVLEIANRT
ncbi:hypothetical protein PRIPAC_79737 [Pristionchus pacificus]|uniref:Acyltransferase n=1 Tax=Pristionchus pacificus TaxID=54126 RepID=A0A2A6BW48_PRIPA|nr:hypothetical protein PRIPAC_79737 [Pristionchus pacificus]|eukprot:PDM69991.1 Acyltransferase [Pristionchus pacificus]